MVWLQVKVQDDQSTPLDHLTFCTLSTLSKLLNDDVIRNPNYSDQLMEIWSKQVPDPSATTDNCFVCDLS